MGSSSRKVYAGGQSTHYSLKDTLPPYFWNVVQHKIKIIQRDNWPSQHELFSPTGNVPTCRPILPFLLLAPILFLLHLTHSYLQPTTATHPIQPNPHNLSRTVPQGLLCLIYDHPGNTGSSAMNFALQACKLNRHHLSDVPDLMHRARNDQFAKTVFALSGLLSHHICSSRAGRWRFWGSSLGSSYMSLVHEARKNGCGALQSTGSSWLRRLGFDVFVFGTMNLANGSLTKPQFENARTLP